MVTFREKVLAKVIQREILHQEGCSSQEALLTLLEGSGLPIRNVCCRMHAADKARLEAVVELVDMSLQEFVMQAIKEAISVSLGVFEDRGMMEWFDSAFEEKLADAGLRLVPNPNQPDDHLIVAIDQDVEDSANQNMQIGGQ